MFCEQEYRDQFDPDNTDPPRVSRGSKERIAVQLNCAWRSGTFKLANNIVWNSTESGWTTDEAACWYVDAMLHPYWRQARQDLEATDAVMATAHGVNVCDVYKSHFAPTVMAKLRAAGAATAFVPANETD